MSGCRKVSLTIKKMLANSTPSGPPPLPKTRSFSGPIPRRLWIGSRSQDPPDAPSTGVIAESADEARLPPDIAPFRGGKHRDQVTRDSGQDAPGMHGRAV